MSNSYLYTLYIMYYYFYAAILLYHTFMQKQEKKKTIKLCKRQGCVGLKNCALFDSLKALVVFYSGHAIEQSCTNGISNVNLKIPLGCTKNVRVSL